MPNTQLLDRRSTWLPRGFSTAGLTTVVLAVAAACSWGDTNGGSSIDAEVFIQTFVDLRISALDTDSQRLAPIDREAILAEHSVTQADLTHFADAHGDDLDFMRDVWNEVELRMDRMPARR